MTILKSSFPEMSRSLNDVIVSICLDEKFVLDISDETKSPFGDLGGKFNVMTFPYSFNAMTLVIV